MKKIVPFNNILTFNTDVSEITAISLEHDIKLAPDSISGVFHISGEYKITDGVRLWDYNTEILNFGNIGGFICLRSVLFFGLSSLILMYIILPICIKLSQKL